ncbi:hypothetical protein C7M84_001783 [Penaeus vannamei]|uniref:Uncharacterized protein n=1 Tax=Penaeus vannamei TaxID=6689 RepID=A0A423TSN4_PENVA|nr:hypothetical protein C7M84_001783 [Penaeus vannamei]
MFSCFLSVSPSLRLSLTRFFSAVLTGPYKVGGVRVVGCEVVWAACGGIVTTPITQQQRSLSSCTEQQAAGSVSISRQPSVSTGEPGSASLSRHSSYEEACATQVAENEQRASPDVSEGSGEEPGAGRSRYTALETLASIQALATSPCGCSVVVGGRDFMGVGVLVWRRWPLKDPSREQVVLRGHEIHQLEFSSNGKFVGILSTREESLYDADAEDEETEVKEESEDQRRGQAAGEGEKKTKEGETEERRKRRKGASAERRHELLLSLWQWPEVDEGGGGVESPVEAGVPRRLVMTRVTQLRSHQVTRMSLARGVPQGVLAVVIAG